MAADRPPPEDGGATDRFTIARSRERGTPLDLETATLVESTLPTD